MRVAAIRYLAFLLFAAGCLSIRSQNRGAGDGEITVRLFSTAVVKAVTITSKQPTRLFCARCAPSTFSGDASVDWSTSNPDRIVVNGRALRDLARSGELHMRTGDGREAAAAGRWRISPGTDGLRVVVTLPKERYVMAVLASEASAGEAPEALKALAVAARSFALRDPHRHGTEGVCDSTHCQALRLRAVTPAIAAAVRATTGETIWFGEKHVPAYFSQHCGGMTEDAAAVWGGKAQPWLASHADPYCQRVPSQWHAVVSEQNLRAALAVAGTHQAKSIESVRILKRDASGRVNQLQLVNRRGDEVITAENFRLAIGRALGWNQLRSDWYTLQWVDGRLIFDGKGHGHGVGLCQAGAAAMAGAGRSYRQILGFYFPSTTVRVLASDSGWHTAAAAGWSLRSTQQDTALLGPGNRALAQARALWSVRGGAQLTVTVYPTTELFRQAAGEPGWQLAATRGAEISLQPMAVLLRHGPVDSLLLHEFLHSLVEQDSGAAAPLWLREGTVEVLAKEPCAGRVLLAVDAVEEGLRHPVSQRQSQYAHQAACGLTRSLMAQHGSEALRSWLRNGVPVNVLPPQQTGVDAAQKQR